jgi:hypothetical protein
MESLTCRILNTKEALVDEVKAAPIVLENVNISSVTDPNWAKRYAVLRGTKLLIYLDGNVWIRSCSIFVRFSLLDIFKHQRRAIIGN